jgi:hypothetical protein
VNYRASFRRGLVRQCALLAAALTGLLVFAAAAQADFGVKPGTFESSLLNEAGVAVDPSQAGAHPAAQQVTFEVNTKNNHYPGSPDGQHPPSGPFPDPDGQLKTTIVELPPGLIGDPRAVPCCEQRDFPPQFFAGISRCPTDAQVGVASLALGAGSGQLPSEQVVPVYNLVPPKGVIARLGFVEVVPVVIDITLRTGGDYGIDATASNLSQTPNIYATRVTLWGAPADESHDGERFLSGARSPGNPEGSGNPLPSDQSRRPFMTNPTRCGVDLTTGLSVDSWETPGSFVSYISSPLSFTGCAQIEFEPTIEASPTTILGDAPTGFNFHLHIPQHEALSTNEVQSLTVLATEGTFNLSFEGDTTPDMPLNAPVGLVQFFLEGLPSIGTGNVGVTGGPGNETGTTPYAIAFRGALARTDVEELTVADGSTPLQITNSGGTVPGQASIATTNPGMPEGSVGSESATAELRDAVVTLPEGMTVNPPSAAVLDACSMEQVGMSSAGVANESPVSCPDASILGKATVVTPPIDHPLPGIVYLARQNENPFNSLLAMYLVIDDPESGILIKLPGKIEADPNTGRLTVSFRENPQLPVEDLSLSLFEGPHASLKTPQTCGVHTVTSTMTPWTAPEGAVATPTSSFAVGGACSSTEASAPSRYSFTAGTVDPTSKAFTPFTLELSRPDGTQPLSRIDATLPPGLLAKLAGVPYCPDAALAAAAAKSGRAELASPSCPAASKVGSVEVGAGAGSAPLYVSGSAYLAGPYKGAPLSLAVVTPAVAGPFDLGTVVVRNALNIDPETAQVHAVSDPLPTILQGIPLDLRSIAIKLDRPEFTLNPTNCNPLAITGAATSFFDQSASLASPFQVDECGRLSFKPKLAISLKGATGRTGHPALKAVLTYPKQGAYANVARAQVNLPHSEFLDQGNIGKTCTKVLLAQHACPAKSIYGRAKAWSPLLDKPLAGPVYLVGGYGYKLPALVAELAGQIRVLLVGKVDTGKNKGIRNTFEAVPDAPVERFVLEMKGGKQYGLLENSEDLCQGNQVAGAAFTAQNGTVLDLQAKIANSCGKGKTKGSGANGPGKKR